MGRALERLRPALVEADDRKTRVPDAHRAIGPKADLVRSATPQSAQQPVMKRLLNSREDENPAHVSFSKTMLRSRDGRILPRRSSRKGSYVVERPYAEIR